MMKNKKSVLLGRIAFFVGLPIFLLFGLLRMWTNTLNALPDVMIPTHAMPAVNARDYFIRANALEQSKLAVECALDTKHYYANKADRPYSDTEKAKIVADNARSLATLRQGFGYPYMEPPIRSSRSGDLLLNRSKNQTGFRHYANLLRLEADTRASKGDYYGAVDSCLDAIRMGEMIPRGGATIGLWSSLAIIGSGANDVGKYSAHLTAPQARTVARRLEKIRTLHVPFSDLLTEEKYEYQAMLMELFRDPDNNYREMSSDPGADGRSRARSFGQKIRLSFLNKRGSFVAYTRYMDDSIAASKQPYIASLVRVPIPNDVLCEILFNLDYLLVLENDRQGIARTAILELRLAIRAYELEHGHLPDTLAQLVPAYLTRLPDDPHAARGSYGYTRNKVGYTLFSTSGYVPPKPKKQH